MSEARLVRRLCAFTAVSIALHAIMLFVYAPRGKGGQFHDDRGGYMVHAVLAPAPAATPSEIETTRTDNDTAASKATEQAHLASGDAASRKKGSDFPLPDKWYTATELHVLAEPLAPANLLYPEEHIAQAIITRVRVRLFVDEGGVVRKLEVVESGAEPAFEAAARKAWQGMRFSPAVKDGVAVKSQKLLELEFLPF